MITLEQIENIVIDIKSDDEWVNDSQTQAEYKGVCDGLDMLVNHLKVIGKSEVITIKVEGGYVVDVENMPKGYEYIIDDADLRGY